MKIVYMGTPDFAVPALGSISEAGHEICCVVSQPDSAKGRGKKVAFTPVKKKALELGLHVLQPDTIKNNSDFLAELRKYRPDVIVIAAYGRILRKDILDIPRLGCINIHASLLPRFRGAAPIQRAIIEGDEYTGVTIMMVEEGLDTGDMLAVRKTKVDRKTAAFLHDELAETGAELIVDVLRDIESGSTVRTPQDNSLSTYAPMISKKDGEIDFSMSAAEIERRIRAYDPWPGAYTYYKGELLKIWDADVFERNNIEYWGRHPGGKPGTVFAASADGIGITAAEGYLMVKALQLPGKKKMSAGDFLKGNSIEIMTVLG